MTARSLIPALTTVAAIALTAGCAGFSLMLDEPRWDSTGAATFAEIRREFNPLP